MPHILSSKILVVEVVVFQRIGIFPNSSILFSLFQPLSFVYKLFSETNRHTTHTQSALLWSSCQTLEDSISSPSNTLNRILMVNNSHKMYPHLVGRSLHYDLVSYDCYILVDHRGMLSWILVVEIFLNMVSDKIHW